MYSVSCFVFLQLPPMETHDYCIHLLIYDKNRRIKEVQKKKKFCFESRTTGPT